MSYKEAITSTDFLYLVPENIKNQVKQAIESGKKVEFEHSSFDDPGADYSRVLLEDKVIYSMKGY